MGHRVPGRKLVSHHGNSRIVAAIEVTADDPANCFYKMLDTMRGPALYKQGCAITSIAH